MSTTHPQQSSKGAPTVQIDWRHGLPELVGQRLVLRELRPTDAETLYSELTTPDVTRFMWSPPPNAGAFAQFIDWAQTERATGKYICYGVVPRGEEHACGVFELRQLQPGFLRGELGFVIATRLWGTGVFLEGAELMLDFAFNVVHVHRIEARSAVDNDRGNAALRRLGADREGTLKDAFWREDRWVDQFLWAILDSRWRKPSSFPEP